VRAPAAALLGLVLILCGTGFESPSLSVTGVGMIGLAAFFTVWVELARPRRLVRAPGPARLVEGELYPVRIDARRALVPLPGGSLSDPLLEVPVSLGPRSGSRFEFKVEVEGRGRHVLAPASLEVRDPLGLHRRQVRTEESGTLLVLPRIEPVLAAGRGSGRGRRSVLAGIEEGAATARIDARAIELEVDGLRAYREGSPAARIHWPAVARTGELVERNLVAGGDSAPLVVLDASEPDGAESLDAAVRAATSLAFHLAGAGGCALLLPGDRRPAELEDDLHGWAAVHARLALVEAIPAPPPVSRALRSGSVFWVAARATARLPRALHSGAAERYLVVPGHGTEGGVAFSVAGCEGRRLGGRRAARFGRKAAA
jgi:uncharacterized protein (DUF58 family)